VRNTSLGWLALLLLLQTLPAPNTTVLFCRAAPTPAASLLQGAWYSRFSYNHSSTAVQLDQQWAV